MAGTTTTQRSSGSTSSNASLEKISQLETAVLASPFDPNPLLPLLAFARHPLPEIVHKAIWALHRVFIRYIDEGRVGNVSGKHADREYSSEAEEGDVRGWVRDRLTDYLGVLGGLIRDVEPALRSSALPLLFALLPPHSSSISQSGHPTIHTPYFRMILHYLLIPQASVRGRTGTADTLPGHQVDLDEGILPPDVLRRAHEDFWAKYDDLRWAFFREALTILKTGSRPLSHPSNLLGQLLPLTNLPRLQEDLNTFFIPTLASPPLSPRSKQLKVVKRRKKKGRSDDGIEKLPDWMATYESDSSSSEIPTKATGKRERVRTTQLSVHSSIHSVPSHRNQYTTLWEEVFVNVPLDDYWTRRILVGLHGESGILGHMRAERRVRVADWLGGLVDRGGANALLAMNGLFILMTQFNLDYPNFYDKLYALLDRNVLHVKYRARFFRLLDTFLASTLLPAALVASFIKRIARLTLTAPPAGIIMLIPFIYNLLKRHPGCMVMIQRHGDDDNSPYTDPYKEAERSPLTSNAIASSLWELAAMRSHYLGSVSTMAKVFEEVFTKPEFNLEDFLDHGYGTLFDTEINRKLKRPPALALALEASDGSLGDIFPGKEADKEGSIDSDIVAQLWCF